MAARRQADSSTAIHSNPFWQEAAHHIVTAQEQSSAASAHHFTLHCSTQTGTAAAASSTTPQPHLALHQLRVAVAVGQRVVGLGRRHRPLLLAALRRLRGARVRAAACEGGIGAD